MRLLRRAAGAARLWVASPEFKARRPYRIEEIALIGGTITIRKACAGWRRYVRRRKSPKGILAGEGNILDGLENGSGLRLPSRSDSGGTIPAAMATAKVKGGSRAGTLRVLQRPGPKLSS